MLFIACCAFSCSKDPVNPNPPDPPKPIEKQEDLYPQQGDIIMENPGVNAPSGKPLLACGPTLKSGWKPLMIVANDNLLVAMKISGNMTYTNATSVFSQKLSEDRVDILPVSKPGKALWAEICQEAKAKGFVLDVLNYAQKYSAGEHFPAGAFRLPTGQEKNEIPWSQVIAKVRQVTGEFWGEPRIWLMHVCERSGWTGYTSNKEILFVGYGTSAPAVLVMDAADLPSFIKLNKE